MHTCSNTVMILKTVLKKITDKILRNEWTQEALTLRDEGSGILHLPHHNSKPEALKSLYRSPGNKKKKLVLCKNYVLQW